VLVGAAAALVPAPAVAAAAQPAGAPVEEGYRSLDDTSGWRQAGPGGFTVGADGTRTSFGGLGMTWYQAEEFGSYSFKVDWRHGGEGNSGIFIGFPPSDDPYSAVTSGYEIQIDPEDPSGNTTGAIYDVRDPDVGARDGAVRTGPDEWNTYEILVEGQRVRVLLNDVLVNDFTNTDPARGLGRGHIGLQNHGDGDTVAFRNIRIKELAPPGPDYTTPSGGGTEVPPQEPGVTLRVFDLQTPQTRLCTLKPGQTPNVDKLLPAIDWVSAEDFGVEEYFAAQVVANLDVPAAGEYAFRLISDDGSRLLIDDAVVVNHDGLHGATPKDGTVTLDEGYHALRIDHFENTVDQQITLQWRPPGSSEFVVVPNSVLSTDAGVVRVTAPGRKECEQVGDSPGDGLPLTGVHPGFTLTDLRPDGFRPKVSGLEWFPDGRLAVLTWGGTDNSGSGGLAGGEVYVLSGVTGQTGPDQVTVQKVADGLKEPMGIKIVDGTIYVSEKQRLTRLVDSTGDGVTDDYQTVAELPFGGNFHEFAFGLLYEEPHFILNLSVSIDYGGATTHPQPAPNRGTTVRIDENTGELTYVAGGLRTPNGIGYGPEGGIFVTDNQGAWLPSSKLLHIKQGRFFNHYTDPDGPFDANPVTPPVLWLPQNEIANSPSTPLMLTEGTFAGQMLFGDVTYGGIQRAFLEKIGGEYQGAVFRMTQGLEAGVTRISLGPDGAIYAGGLGAGGNWGQAGKLDHGLQKLTPNGTSTFDILAMRAVPGGFEVEYTQPVSPETASGLATRYTVQQWRYVPTADYGGPKVDERTLPVTSAGLSPDGRKVTLQIDGLEAGHVVHLRSPRPFSSDSGQSLWSTEAWYTLNTLPS
jgi:hypothetical protein